MKYQYEPWFRKNIEHESNIHKFRVAHGLTIKQLAKKAGVSINTIVGLTNGSLSPLCEKGKLKESANKLCITLHCDTEELFPRYFCNIKIPSPPTNQQTLSCTLSDYSLKKSASVEEQAIILHQKNQLLLLICTLSQRECDIIQLRFWNNYTLEQVAISYNVSRTRIRNIEKKAIRRLREKSSLEKYGHNEIKSY